MPSWDQLLTELHLSAPGQIDLVRRKYLKQLHKKTGRNIISYYSGWLHCANLRDTDINDGDMNGFMTSVHGMDRKLGLDLILHTPGGSISATEQIVTYLKSMFNNDIRVFIPQIAMSAGTMIACSCSEIIMGKHSCLGPIDPQLNGVSARGVVEEFERAKKETKDDPSSIPIWSTIIAKYHPTFIDSCVKAWNRSVDIVEKWLTENMFAQDDQPKEKAALVVQKLLNTGHSLGHDKHISIDDAQRVGLKILPLEEDQSLQDSVLTVHHCFVHTLSSGSIIKAIENHKGIGVFNVMGRPQV